MVEDAEGDGLYLALIIDFAGTEDQVVVHFQTRFQHFTDNLGDIHLAKKAKRIFILAIVYLLIHHYGYLISDGLAMRLLVRACKGKNEESDSRA